MTTAKGICCFVIVLTAVHFGLAIGETGIRDGLGTDVFSAGYSANPWHAVVDVDLMAGLVLLVSWILWRDPNRTEASIWIIIILFWGNLVSAVYIYRQLSLSGGSWQRFFLGKHSGDAFRLSKTRATPPLLIRLALWTAALALSAFVVIGCKSSRSMASLMGYVWGFGGFIPALVFLARSAGTQVPS